MGSNFEYDFSGWATRNNLKCSDGRIIGHNAFKDNDGQIVPLVWNHQHNDPLNVLGHALLKNENDGVYTYCKFNDTDAGKTAKTLVEHGDVSALSIYANGLKQNGATVLHGSIREVSLVLAGANPGAFIDSVIRHGENCEEEAVIYTGEKLELSHSEEEVIEEVVEEVAEDAVEEELSHADEPVKEESDDDETVQDVIDSMTEKQQKVLYGLVGAAIEDAKNNSSKEEDSEGGKESMKHNVFDQDVREDENVISHSDMMAVIKDGPKCGSLKEAALAHGITEIAALFPEAKTMNNPPEFIRRDDSWVKVLMNKVHKSPFSRVKSIFANITEDEARARGYIKGKKKVEEVFSLLKRKTDPQTVYKLQKFDRDDIIDITDFDVVSWVKGEMRFMLEEECARAILTGDGRPDSSDDKISPLHIRPIWTDDDLYTIKAVIPTTAGTTDDAKAKAFIRTAIKARKNYKGSGNPILFTTEDVLTDCLLLEDANGRVIYDTEEKLRTALRVSQIVTVEVMEGAKRTVENKVHELMGLIINPVDYNVGADKGGATTMFDDFDIDYNKYAYLIETRFSGALIKPYSAIAIEFDTGSNSAAG